jgi:hypothetical protein
MEVVGSAMGRLTVKDDDLGMHAGDSLGRIAGGIAHYTENRDPCPSHPGNIFRAVHGTYRCPVCDTLYIDTLSPCVYEMLRHVIVIEVEDRELYEMPAPRIVLFARYYGLSVCGFRAEDVQGSLYRPEIKKGGQGGLCTPY